MRASVTILVLAWSPVAAVLVVALLGAVDHSPVLRLSVTALVYAPLAVIVLRKRTSWLAVIVAALAITSGWLALTLVAHQLAGADSSLGAAIHVVAYFARQAELAALGIVPWLFVRKPRLRVAGVSWGCFIITVDTARSITAVVGVMVPFPLVFASLVGAIAGFIVAAITLAGERGHDDRGRQAVAWLVSGVVLLAVSYGRALAEVTAPFASLFDAAFVLAQALLPTGIIALSIVDRQLEPDRRLVTGIAWAQAVAAAICLYLVVDLVARGLSAPPAVAGALAAAALALAFGATVRLISRRTVRLYFGPGADARSVLERLGERIGDADDPEGSIRAIAAALRDAWDIESVAIRSTADDEVVVVGVPGAATLEVGLRTGGRPVGSVELTSDDHRALDEVVRPVMEEISGLVAAAVLLAGINREVASTRRRTLGVRSEERRMLHGQLHDDLAPSLAGIAFGMTAAERLATADPTGARAAVAALRPDVAACADKVRQLARTLLPAALDAGDLDAALIELARQFDGDAVTVTAHSSGTDVLGLSVQIAAYLAVADALTGLWREPDVRRVEVSTRVESDRLIVMVEADGRLGDAVALSDVLDAVDSRARDVGGRASTLTSGALGIELVMPR